MFLCVLQHEEMKSGDTMAGRILLILALMPFSKLDQILSQLLIIGCWGLLFSETSGISFACCLLVCIFVDWRTFFLCILNTGILL